MNQDKIIYISAIIPYPQDLFDENIKLVHINIRKYLTGQISYRESLSVFSTEETFTFRKSYPISSLSADLHSFLRIREDDDTDEIAKYILFVFLDLRTTNQILDFLP